MEVSIFWEKRSLTIASVSSLITSLKKNRSKVSTSTPGKSMSSPTGNGTLESPPAADSFTGIDLYSLLFSRVLLRIRWGWTNLTSSRWHWLTHLRCWSTLSTWSHLMSLLITTKRRFSKHSRKKSLLPYAKWLRKNLDSKFIRLSLQIWNKGIQLLNV